MLRKFVGDFKSSLSSDPTYQKAVSRLPGLASMEPAEIASVRAAFDADFYREKYPDIKSSGVDPFEHYMLHGWRERRSPSLDFERWYSNVMYTGGDEVLENPFLGWIRDGKPSTVGLDAIGGDAGKYTSPDAPADTPSDPSPMVLGLDSLDPAEIAEVRAAFDDEFYTERYPDIRESGVDPFEHYMIHGWKERRSPAARFDINYYSQFHMRLDDEIQNPLVHFIVNKGIRDVFPNEVEKVEKSLRALQTYEQLIRQSLGPNSVLESDVIRTVVWNMFSADEYRKRTGVGDETTDLECFLRYLVTEFSAGVSPGSQFDGQHYVSQLLQRGESAQCDPYRAYLHWLTSGAARRISPNRLFNEADYIFLNPDLANHPDYTYFHLIKHGIREGRRFNPVVTVSPPKDQSHSSAAVKLLALSTVSPHASAEIDGNLRFWRSEQMRKIIDKAVRIDPQVVDISERDYSALAPWHDDAYQVFANVCNQLSTPFENVVLMPFGKLGGADYVGSILANTLGSLGKTVVLRTDQSDWERPEWFSSDVFTFDLSKSLRSLDLALRKRTLYEILRYLKPRNVFNVNSLLAFETFEIYGARLQMQADLFCYYFCADRTAEGREAGYPVSYFANIVPYLSGALFDSEQLCHTIRDRYCLGGSIGRRLRVLYTPSQGSPETRSLVERQIATRSRRKSPSVMWAGRFDRQKRFDLLVQIAKRMPDVTFRCWGAAVLDPPPSMADLPRNIEMNAPFKSLSELPTEFVDGFLYTSAWDGLPTILIEMGSRGMPVVASAVGGVPELIDETTGWPVADTGSVEDYVATLREMLGDPTSRESRSGRLRHRVSRRHNREAYLETIRELAYS